MKVYIVHRDVPYEFGSVLGVFLVMEAARRFILNVTGRADKADELSIEIWETDTNVQVDIIPATDFSKEVTYD